MSVPPDPRDVLTVEVDELTQLTCEFESADGLPDRPAELRHVVRLGEFDRVSELDADLDPDVPPDAVRLPGVKRRGA